MSHTSSVNYRNSVDIISVIAHNNRNELIEGLVSGYEERRAVTRLVNIAKERILSGEKISFEQNNSTSIWKAGTVVLDLNVTRTDDPTFCGLITHVFKLWFDDEYARDFEAAVNAIGDAYESFFIQKKVEAGDRQKLADAANRKQLSDYEAEKMANTKLIEAKEAEFEEIKLKFRAPNEKAQESSQRVKDAKQAIDSSKQKCDSLVQKCDVLNAMNTEVTKYALFVRSLPRKAELIFDCKLEKGSAQEKEMVEKISSREKRESLIEDFKGLHKAELEIQAQAQAKLKETEAVLTQDNQVYQDLLSRLRTLGEEKIALMKRNMLLDLEIASLKALVP